MNYVRCIKNDTLYEGDVADSLYPLSIIGHVYKVAPPHVNDGDSLRVIDEEGEDYLYPADYFEPYKSSEDQDAAMISVHLSGYLKNILRAEALAANKSVSVLLREWAEERLDLPAMA